MGIQPKRSQVFVNQGEDQFSLGHQQTIQAQSTLARSNVDSPLSTHAIPVIGQNLVLNMPAPSISVKQQNERAEALAQEEQSPISSDEDSLALRISEQMNSRKRTRTQAGHQRNRSSKEAKLIPKRLRNKSQLLDVLIPPVGLEGAHQRRSFEASKAFGYEKDKIAKEIKVVGTTAIH